MISGSSDQDPVELLKSDSEEAFASIYNQYWDKLYYLAYQKLKSQYLAEEIVHEVFITLWSKRAKLSINSLPAYLAAMVRHAVYRHIMMEKSKTQREFVFHTSQEQYVSLDKEIEDKFILEKLLELSNQLPEKCRLVFQSNKLDDQSLSDIAKQLNISQKTAEAHLTKALKSIRLSMSRFMSFFLL